mgnify:CR=1 FL=1
MGDLYHIDADGLQAHLRCESWNCCQFSLHCHLTAALLQRMTHFLTLNYLCRRSAYEI